MMDKEELVEKVETPDLPKCMQAVISELRAAGKLPAVHTHTCTMHSFNRFAGTEGESMPITEVFTEGTLKGYEQWLVQQGKSWNTVSTYMRALQSTYYRMVENEKIAKVPKLFQNVYTKVEARTKRSLTKEQTETLLHTDFTELPAAVQRAFAYFLLMFLFRGMPFIDLAYLRKKDIRGNSIVYCRHKTGRQITVRIPREAVQLLEEFQDADPSSVYLFPILSEGKEKTGLYNHYQKALRCFNKKLMTMAALLLPGVKISSYTARHTWATLAFHQGVAIGIISRALGHSSVKVTETYLKPFEDEKIDRANDELIDAVAMCREKKDAA